MPGQPRVIAEHFDQRPAILDLDSLSYCVDGEPDSRPSRRGGRAGRAEAALSGVEGCAQRRCGRGRRECGAGPFQETAAGNSVATFRPMTVHLRRIPRNFNLQFQIENAGVPQWHACSASRACVRERERSTPSKRRARERVGESEGPLGWLSCSANEQRVCVRRDDDRCHRRGRLEQLEFLDRRLVVGLEGGLHDHA